VYLPGLRRGEPDYEEAGEGRRRISGNAARAAADDDAAADSEQAEQREKRPGARAARATPGFGHIL
jgi:hypothetical protein